jgi:cytoskeletal protein RodZ
MPTTPFGERLKREREMRGVSLDEVSVATRIKPQYLAALENEQWSQLPGGVFNRGFIRTIARFLGMDEENVLAEYAMATKDVQTVPTIVRMDNFEATDRRWMAVVGLVLFLLALGVAALIAYRHYRGSHEAPKTEAARILHGGAVRPEMRLPAIAAVLAGESKLAKN